LRVHDENALPSHPVTAKGTHQRNKSSTTLPSLMQNGAVRAGAKRAVFADVSNTIRTAPVTDNGVKTHDNGKAAAIYLEPLVVSKPAQKPLAVKNITAAIAPTAALPTIRKVQAKKSVTILGDSAAPAATTIDDTTAGETEPSSEGTTDEVETQQGVAIADDIKEDPAVGFVQPPQALNHPEAVILDTNALEQFAPEVEEKVVVLSQSLISVNDDDYDEEYEEELYEGSQTMTRGGVTDNTTGGATAVLCPKHTARTLREIEEAKQVVESTRTPEDIEDDQWDTSMVAEYGDEIFEYMRTLEVC
jgi:G2/mitotic-specific cyclin 3/4